MTGSELFLGAKGVRPLLILLCVLGSVFVVSSSARADFADGARAYDAGDYAEALAQWRAAAEAGDPQAQVAIAGLYHFGEGVRLDVAEAARWYARAARGGNADAQQILGDLFAKGQGVPRDLLKAHMWLSLASNQGREWAEQRRRQVAAQLGLDELAECKRRVMPVAPGSN